MRLSGRRVVLGVSGGIASYKACIVARRLAEVGAEVDVVLTRSAAEFVRPVTFEALTGRAVHTSLWDPDRALAHVELAREAHLIVIAPATAHLLSRAAQGLADDLLTALLLARTGPVLVAPAMNDRMFAHPATQANLKLLRARGWTVVGPDVGALAEGPSELPGRMVEPETIVAHAERMLRATKGKLAGRRVVVTAGPTREALDPVRVLTNRSSGRMGFAVASAAFARGAEVKLIAGPTQLSTPAEVETVRVETTEELGAAVTRSLKGADVLIMAAAPADFRPRSRTARKRPRSEGSLTLEFDPTSDILEATRKQRAKCLTVGFALESGDGLARARDKLARKGVSLLVVNRADQEDAGAEVDTNRVTFLSEKGTAQLPLMSKAEVAERILDAVEDLL